MTTPVLRSRLLPLPLMHEPRPTPSAESVSLCGMRRLAPTVALPFALSLVACTEEPAPAAVASAEPIAKAEPAAIAPPAQVTPQPLGAEAPTAEAPTAEAPTAQAPAVPQNGSAGAGVFKTVPFPGGDLAIPVDWQPKLRSEPPMTAVHVIPVPAMTCDFAILEGHGTPQRAEEYLAAGANAYLGDTVRAPDIEVGGHAFQGIHVTNPKALPSKETALVEVYAAISGEDLMGIGVTRLEQSEALEEGRRRCLQAFAQLTSKLPPPAATPR